MKQHRQRKDQQSNNNLETEMWRKQLYGYFKRQTNEITHEKKLTWLRKGNLNTETESLLIAAQINAIRMNDGKIKIDKMQKFFFH